jgi:hypothetical protein
MVQQTSSSDGNVLIGMKKFYPLNARSHSFMLLAGHLNLFFFTQTFANFHLLAKPTRMVFNEKHFMQNVSNAKSEF